MFGIYSIVQKGHKGNPDQIKGDFFFIYCKNALPNNLRSAQLLLYLSSKSFLNSLKNWKPIKEILIKFDFPSNFKQFVCKYAQIAIMLFNCSIFIFRRVSCCQLWRVKWNMLSALTCPWWMTARWSWPQRTTGSISTVTCSSRKSAAEFKF